MHPKLSTQTQTQQLAELLLECAPADGIHTTSLAGVSAIRLSKPGDELAKALHRPAVCLIAQGAKRVLLRDEVYTYDPSRVLVFSVDLPISAQVTEASPARPYLCFRLDIDAVQMAELVDAACAGSRFPQRHVARSVPDGGDAGTAGCRRAPHAACSFARKMRRCWRRWPSAKS